MHLGRVGRQARIDEHPVVRIALDRLEQQVGPDLEVVVHPIAQAVVVDEGDRLERQLARVEADAEAARADPAARRGTTAKPIKQRAGGERRQRRAEDLALGSGQARAPGAAGDGQRHGQERRRDEREVGAEADRVERQHRQRQHGRERARSARRRVAPARRRAASRNATPPRSTRRVDDQRRVGDPARRPELVDGMKRREREVQAQVANEPEADRRRQHRQRAARAAQRPSRRAPRRRAPTPRRDRGGADQQRRHEHPGVQVGPDDDRGQEPGRRARRRRPAPLAERVDRRQRGHLAQQREEVRPLDEAVAPDERRRRQRQRARHRPRPAPPAEPVGAREAASRTSVFATTTRREAAARVERRGAHLEQPGGVEVRGRRDR